MKLKNRSLFTLGVFALALVSIAAQAAGIDVSGFAFAHGDWLAAAGAFGVVTEIKAEELGAALREFSTKANEKIDANGKRVEAVEQKSAAFDARIAEIEQKQDRGVGTGRSVGDSGENVGALVVKEGHIEALRDGNVKNFRVAVKSFPLSTKATLTSSSFPGQADRDPEIYGPLTRRFSVRDLLVKTTTTQGSVEFLQATVTGAAAIQATEGAVKAELGAGFVLKTSPVRTIACWVPASRQLLDDNSQMLDFINTTLLDALQLTEDTQLLAGDGTGGNVLGLLPQAAAFNRYKQGDTYNDRLRRAVTQVQLARGVASGIVINPIDLEAIELDKDSQGRYVMALTVTNENGSTTTWRVPVVVTDAIAQGTFMVGDFTRSARLYDRQQGTVEIATEHADFFVRNLVACLAEERLALTVPRPDLLVTGLFAPPSNRLPATPGPLLPA